MLKEVNVELVFKFHTAGTQSSVIFAYLLMTAHARAQQMKGLREWRDNSNGTE
jgi:hypothetical protein